MSRWPWLTGIVVALPLTHDIFHAARRSGERWMQDFWRLVFCIVVAAAVLLGLPEWGIRTIVARRRGARALVTGMRAHDKALSG
jgi:hypothetical protein